MTVCAMEQHENSEFSIHVHSLAAPFRSLEVTIINLAVKPLKLREMGKA
jgi:hypothetical protein